MGQLGKLVKRDTSLSKSATDMLKKLLCKQLCCRCPWILFDLLKFYGFCLSSEEEYLGVNACSKATLDALSFEVNKLFEEALDPRQKDLFDNRDKKKVIPAFRKNNAIYRHPSLI